MSDVTIAVLSGVLIFTLGQILQHFVLEPLQNYHRLIGEVAAYIIYYSNFSSVLTPPEEIKEARRKLRTLSCDLRASVWTVPFYRFWALVGVVHRRKAVMEACNELIGWSNSLGDERSDRRDAIMKFLKFKW